MKATVPFSLSINREETNISILVEHNITYFKHEEDIYIMPPVNHEDGQYLMDIRFDDGQLNIQDRDGLSLIPEDVKINETSVNNITTHQNYTTCKITGENYISYIYKF